MKRKRGFLTALCTLVLAGTLTVSTLGIDKAFAATPDTFDLTGINTTSTVIYGEEVAVPSVTGYTAAVKAPNGTAAAIAADKFTANQLGVYIVTYTNTTDGNTYSYRVYCNMEQELTVKVANEANVPTIVATNAVVELPAGEIGYYDEEGEWIPVQDAEIKVGGTAVTATDGKYTYTFATKGSNFVTYSAKIANGAKYLSKAYEVKVQDDFTDEKAPTLTVSGVPSSANINTEITLPQATASDSYDERVAVEVVVKYTQNNEEKKIVLDNDENMTFTPATAGAYKVTYQAIDDSGNKSAVWTYTITVSDKKAPTITVDDTVIPSKWGQTVKKLVDNADVDQGTEAVANAVVKFPRPEVEDNLDESVKVAFTIRDPESRTVVSIANINGEADSDETKYTSTVVDGKTYVFNKTTATFDFNFDEYIKACATDYTSKGNYTVTYRATDAAGNTNSKTFTIDVQNEFVDDEPVNVEFTGYVKKIVASETKAVEYVVPAPTYSSVNDGKLTLVYNVVGKEDATLAVEAGDVIELKKTNTGYELVKTVDEVETKVAVDGSFKLQATVTSDAGNTKTATSENIVVLTDGSTTFTLGELSTAATYTAAEAAASIGSVTISGVSDKQNVGVEVGVRNADGEYMTGVTAVIYNFADTKVVKLSADLTVKENTDFYAEVRAFDAHGNSQVSVRKFTVTAVAVGGGTVVSSVTNATTAELNSVVELSNEEMIIPSSITIESTQTAIMVREIKGGRFALIGTEFIPMSTGAYELSDKVDVVLTAGQTSVYAADSAEGKILAGVTEKSTLQVKDTAAVSFELQGDMPSYAALNATVTLPAHAAFTANANADSVDVDVKAPNGTKVDTVESNGATTFVATANGEYTVTYTVKMTGKEDTTYSYKIKAGDVVAPTFTISGKHDTSVEAGYELKFFNIVVSGDDAGEDAIKKLTFTKTIIGPDGETVGTAISGTGKTYADKQYTGSVPKLEQSGKYIVRYEVKDAAGNVSKQEYEIIVTDSSGNGGISLAVLSTILIVVGVLLIAGVIVYLFRFRTVKKDKKSKKDNK